MKRILLIVSFTVSCPTPRAFSADSLSDPGHFYFAASGGINWLESVGFRNTSGSGTFHFDPGIRFDAAGGYQLTSWLGVEVETGLTWNRIQTLSGGLFEENSLYLFQMPILANVTLRLPTNSRLKPFLGGGAGGVYTSLENWDLFSNEFDGEDFTFGYQGFAGLRFEINPKIELGLAYKFLGTTEHSLQHMDPTLSHAAVVSFAMGF